MSRATIKQQVSTISSNGREPGKMELKQEFVELRAKGYSLRKAAKKLDISKSTAANWQAELEAEIATAKAIELEALYERAYKQLYQGSESLLKIDKFFWTEKLLLKLVRALYKRRLQQVRAYLPKDDIREG